MELAYACILDDMFWDAWIWFWGLLLLGLIIYQIGEGL